MPIYMIYFVGKERKGHSNEGRTIFKGIQK